MFVPTKFVCDSHVRSRFESQPTTNRKEEERKGEIDAKEAHLGTSQETTRKLKAELAAANEGLAAAQTQVKGKLL